MSYANLIPPRRVALEAAYRRHAQDTGLKSATLDELWRALDFVCDDGEGGRDCLSDTRAAAMEEAASVAETMQDSCGGMDCECGDIPSAIRALKS